MYNINFIRKDFSRDIEKWALKMTTIICMSISNNLESVLATNDSNAKEHLQL